ncbi:hypothetical protein HJFPF1_04424 [Paramyrothecium foliicola]|nr:hypothetical protein HJFPF1_04424 [Paramyrothecium foliicola]
MLFSTAFMYLFGGAMGHAVMTQPVPRKTGAEHKKVCGENVTKYLERDKAGPIENAMKYVDANYKCDAYLCRGYQFNDNKSNAKPLSAGDVLDFQIDLIAGHRPGYANVSVVDTTTNAVIGEPLKTWAEWPMSGLEPQDDTEFNITIPDGLESSCNVAGKCVIQWYWYAIKNVQTNEALRMEGILELKGISIYSCAMAARISSTRCTVGWIAPMAPELTPAIEVLEEREKCSFDGDDNIYHVGRVGYHYVVIAVCPTIGTHPAATLLAHMRRSFPNIKHVLVVGIGGGMPRYGPNMQEQIVLGDVVVSVPQGREGGVAHYEFGAWEGEHTFSPGGHTLHPSSALLTAVRNLQSAHMRNPGTNIPEILTELISRLTEEESAEFKDPGSRYDRVFKDEYHHADRDRLCDGLCDPSQSTLRSKRGSKAQRKTNRPRVHYGTIGSANALVLSSAKRNRLYKDFQVICVEMEAAGVMSHHQGLVIRGICDYADSHKNKRWQKYAAATAAAYAKELLLTLPATPSIPGNASSTECVGQNIHGTWQATNRHGDIENNKVIL